MQVNRIDNTRSTTPFISSRFSLHSVQASSIKALGVHLLSASNIERLGPQLLHASHRAKGTKSETCVGFRKPTLIFKILRWILKSRVGFQKPTQNSEFPALTELMDWIVCRRRDSNLEAALIRKKLLTLLGRTKRCILGLPKIWAHYKHTVCGTTELISEEARLAKLVGMGVRIQSASAEKDARPQV